MKRWSATHLLLSHASIRSRLVGVISRLQLGKSASLSLGNVLELLYVDGSAFELSLDRAKFGSATAQDRQPASSLLPRNRHSPKVGNSDLELFLDRATRVDGGSVRASSFVDGELLLLGCDLKQQVGNTLFEVSLRSLGDEKTFASLLVFRCLRVRTDESAMACESGRGQQRSAQTCRDALGTSCCRSPSSEQVVVQRPSRC